MALSREDVAKLYIAMFDRAPEKEGLDNWYQAAQANNWGVAELANSMIAAAQQVVASDPTYQNFYPQYVNVDLHDPNSVRDIISTVYEILFNKTYQDDPGGIDGWVNNVVNNGQPLGEAIASIIIVADQIAAGAIPVDAKTLKAAQAFENKVQVALYSADTLPSADIDGDGKYDFGTFQDFIKNVNENTGNIEEAKFAIEKSMPNKLAFTTGVDSLTGTEQDDTFIADLGTLNDGDSVDGKGGVDTLAAKLDASMPNVTLTSIEKLHLVATQDGAIINVSPFTDTKSLEIGSSVGDLRVTVGDLHKVESVEVIAPGNVQVEDITKSNDLKSVKIVADGSVRTGIIDAWDLIQKGVSEANISIEAGGDVYTGFVGDSDLNIKSVKIVSHNGSLYLDDINTGRTDGVKIDLEASGEIVYGNNNGSNVVVMNEGIIDSITLKAGGKAEVYINANDNYDTNENGYVKLLDASGVLGGASISLNNNVNYTHSGEYLTTVKLGAANSSVTNKLWIMGNVDAVDVQGSVGNDKLYLHNFISKGMVDLGEGTDDLDMMMFARKLEDANEGLIVNFTDLTQQMDGKNVGGSTITDFDGTIDGIDNSQGYVDFTVKGIDNFTGSQVQDIIFANDNGMHLDGSGDNDILFLGAGADVVKLGIDNPYPSSDPNTVDYNSKLYGHDTVKNFSSADRLDISQIVGNNGVITNASIIADTSMGGNNDTTIDSNGTDDVNGNIALILGKDTISSSDINSTPSDGKITLSDNGMALLIIASDVNDHTFELYFAWDKDKDSGQVAYSVEHVATVEGDTTVSLSDFSNMDGGLIG